MIDIHTHLLPGVDDGAQDLYDSVQMAEAARESGTRIMVCTTHSNLMPEQPNYAGEELEVRFRELKEELERREIGVQVLPGMEIFGTEEVPDLIREGRLIGLNYTKYYLIEFDFGSDDTYMTRILQRMRNMDIIPVVAHPERYDAVQEDPRLAELWKEMGCLLQVNRASLFGRFGRLTYDAARELFFEELVDFIASDTHGPYRRTPYLRDAWEFVMESYSAEVAQLLLNDNQRRILESEASPYNPEGKKPLSLIY